MIRAINRILNWLMRDAVFDHGELAPGGKLEWHRFRTGFVSGPYMILTNRGGGVLVSWHGLTITDGKMVDSIEAAQQVCEDHARWVEENYPAEGWAIKSRQGDTREAAADLFPSDLLPDDDDQDAHDSYWRKP